MNTSERIRHETLAAYGGRCECCGESKSEFLTIDHKFGLTPEERLQRKRRSGGGWRLYYKLKKLGYPRDRYRLLCFNCNSSRGFMGYCPHDLENGILEIGGYRVMIGLPGTDGPGYLERKRIAKDLRDRYRYGAKLA